MNNVIKSCDDIKAGDVLIEKIGSVFVSTFYVKYINKEELVVNIKNRHDDIKWSRSQVETLFSNTDYRLIRASEIERMMTMLELEIYE